jgi:6,7-dimethyl-8-ribityllumazine synthase
MPSVHVPLFRVPGAFEIPVCVNYLLQNSNPVPDAIIALGVVIRGETAHADLVGTSVTNALMELAVSQQVPIIHEVLLTNSREEAEERCSGEKKRGVEAAKSAITMAELFAKLESVVAPTTTRKPVVANSNG